MPPDCLNSRTAYNKKIGMAEYNCAAIILIESSEIVVSAHGQYKVGYNTNIFPPVLKHSYAQLLNL